MADFVRWVVTRAPGGWRRYDCADNDEAELETAARLGCSGPRFRLAVKADADALVQLLNKLADTQTAEAPPG